MQRLRFALMTAYCCLLLLGGCGGDSLGRQAISGAVSVDGAPLERGNVSFHPSDKGATSSGAAVAAGKYSIPRDKGLSAGKYRVTINAPKPGTGQAAAEGAMPGDPLPPAQELIPPAWNTNSENFVEVTAGNNEFNFDVKTKAK